MTTEAEAEAPSRRASPWAGGVALAAVVVWALLVVETKAAWPAFLLLALAWAAAVAVDVVRHQLPDRYTLLGFLAFMVLLLPVALLDGDLGRWGITLVAALANATLLFVLAFVNPRGFGLGDVKLGLSTGAALGWLGAGWGGIGLALLASAGGFVLFAVTSGVLLATGKAGRDTDIAFGPFMVGGVLLTPWVAGLLGLVP